MKDCTELERIKWPVRVRCNSCWGLSIKPIESPRKHLNTYHCNACNIDFTVISNTRFKKTHLFPNQIVTLVDLLNKKRLNEKPSALSKIVGVHHWTMTKIINRIKDCYTQEKLLNKDPVSFFEESLQELGFDKESIDIAVLLLTYKFLSKEPKWLEIISGCSENFVSEAINRIKTCWEPDKEFEEDKEFAWYDQESWNTPKAEVTLTLHILCIIGEISRDPQTKMYSAKLT